MNIFYNNDEFHTNMCAYLKNSLKLWTNEDYQLVMVLTIFPGSWGDALEIQL